MQFFRTILMSSLVVLVPVYVNGVDGFKKFDPVSVYQFEVEVNDITIGEFGPVEGVGPEIEVIEYEDHSEATLSRRPQRNKMESISFKQNKHTPAIYKSLMAWWQECLAGECAKQTVSIHVFDKSQTRTGTLNLTEAYPKTVVADEGFEEVTFEFDLGDYVLATQDPTK